MTPAGLPVPEAPLRNEFRARRVATDAAILRASRRHAELRVLAEQARVRSEQLRGERERLRAQMAIRRSLLNTPDRRAAAAILEAAVEVTGMHVGEVWLEYFALGGDADVARLGRMLAGDLALTRGDHDRLTVVLNERLAQTGWGRPLAYWDGSR